MGTSRRYAVASVIAPLLTISGLFAALPAAGASEIAVSPSVIDREAKPRDIIKGEITLKNESNRMLSVYPDVRDYGTGAPGSLVPWIEITRGVIDIGPGEERVIPYLIHVTYDAKPGYYHGMLWFGTGSLRSDAEAHPERAAEALINIKVLDDAIERLQLSTFIPDRKIFAKEEASFSFGLQNTGNRSILPGGQLRIYDRRGREIAAVPLNAEGSAIAPDTKELLGAVWAADGSFGRYKAVLDLEYGSAGKTVMDTTFFWVLPWWKALSLFTGLSVTVVVASVILHARAMSRKRAVALAEGPSSEPSDDDGRSEYFARLSRKRGDPLRPQQADTFISRPREDASIPERASGASVSRDAVRLSKPAIEAPDPGHVVRLKR